MRVFFVMAMTIFLASCGESNKVAARSEGVAIRLAQAATEISSADSPTKRFKAIRQHLTVEVDASTLESIWRAAQDECTTALEQFCELIGSQISQGRHVGYTNAELKIRIAPERYEAYKKKIIANHYLIEDRVESEDKTAAVIDTEAKLKNISALRDRLRGMLATPNAKLKELIELEQELARVQSELDSLTAIRKALAVETEKIYMRIEFRSERSLTEPGALTPITDALSRAGRTLSESVGGLILFVTAALPWVLAATGLFIVVQKLRRIIRNRRLRRANNSNT